ncbi:MAG: SDR family NAD(P)-dependent oxidoreductase, partial [Calditrichaeota bacterium]|nr:SDR family NAD(P)-dependent oxidoreductase [Calditrichota bacterium]MCB0316846.1 SDR family NAD(P)-dependent oxidoreductase [Calditrichota bacterium]
MKTIIVTGGAQGIGRGICQYLLHQEYRVVIADID